MRLAERLTHRFPSPKCEYKLADSLKVTLAAAWLHFWWWPFNAMTGPPTEGSLWDWVLLILVGLWFATPVAALVALAFIPRDLTRLSRWWQVLVAVGLACAIVNHALHWSP